MNKHEDLVAIVIDQNHLDPRSLTSLVERVPVKAWSDITGWTLSESQVSSRFGVEPAILGAALINFYAELVEAQVGPELYEEKYKKDALRIKAALGRLESVDIAVVAGRDAPSGKTSEEIIKQSSRLLTKALSNTK